MILCLIAASLLVLGGIALTSQATQGVALIAMACFLAICGGIAQAGHQHKQLLREPTGRSSRIGTLLLMPAIWPAA